MAPLDESGPNAQVWDDEGAIARAALATPAPGTDGGGVGEATQ